MNYADKNKKELITPIELLKMSYEYKVIFIKTHCGGTHIIHRICPECLRREFITKFGPRAYIPVTINHDIGESHLYIG